MKKTAQITCVNGTSFWATQKEFWSYVRKGMVVLTGEHPVTGRFHGRRDQLLVIINHMILDKGAPNHLDEVLRSRRKMRP